jgi:hypothetical protein
MKAGNKLGIRGEGRLERFDCDQTSQNGLARLENGSHSTMAEFGYNLKVPKLLSLFKHIATLSFRKPKHLLSMQNYAHAT